MVREKVNRQYSVDRTNLDLPPPPPDPRGITDQIRSPDEILKSRSLPGLTRLRSYKDRQSIFLKALQESLQYDTNQILEEEEIIEELTADTSTTPPPHGECDALKEECEVYIGPLLDRTKSAVSAALVAYDAFEQLNQLHSLMEQAINIQEQNYKMRCYIRDVKALCELKKAQEKSSTELLPDCQISDTEADFENNFALLNSILDPSNLYRRTSSKRQRERERSKSVIADDYQQFIDKVEASKNEPVRRSSAFVEGKSKVSKWTKVKAAFKWERAPALQDGKSSDSGIGLAPINHEVARYLRVPSQPCTGSSVDSIFTSSSGQWASAGGTPGTISSASSIEDIGSGCVDEQRRDSSKSDSRCDSRTQVVGESRRSYSLDGDSILNQVGTDTNDSTSSVPKILSSRLNQTPPPGATGGDWERKLSSKGKGPRRSRLNSDFQSLVENQVVEPTIVSRRTKPPPSPLNLNVKHDFSDLENTDFSISPNCSLKSPSSIKLFKTKSSTPGNSSVPSSPSRQYAFFGDLESDDLSSGDYSEPNFPERKISNRSDYQDQQKEINEKYNELIRKLNQEFDVKRQEWDKIRNACSTSVSSAFSLIGKEESCIKNSPSKTSVSSPSASSSKALEENLTPDFKKKLDTWRVKKQSSIQNIGTNFSASTTTISSASTIATSPTVTSAPVTKLSLGSPPKDPESPKKIDWNKWKTGELKLEGQGLSPLPDQKNLPEEFQKKLEQWNKKKHSTSSQPNQDSLKRSGKSGSGKSDSSKRSSGDEKNEREKRRPERDKEKPEKLIKLKSIVSDQKAKEIEVKTSDGVMKFEGISRKFTRKLYEWEKARGIGPESSTFAFLHPGYCPIDVDKMAKQTAHDNSPTISRSLSLDSLSPNNPTLLSHQTSSLSLNDMNELMEMQSNAHCRNHSDIDFNLNGKYEEPEAVIVEVEDDIIDSAAPLQYVTPIPEVQTPVYKYEEDNLVNAFTFQRQSSCEDEQANKVFRTISNLSSCLLQCNQFNDDSHIGYLKSVLNTLHKSYPDVRKHLINSSEGIKQSFDKVKDLIDDLLDYINTMDTNEACCQDTINERNTLINLKLQKLHEAIQNIYETIRKSKRRKDHVPEINIIADDHSEAGTLTVSTPLIYESEIIIGSSPLFAQTSTLEASDDLSTEQGHDSKKVNRNSSNSSKKKVRLRKMGSRQNSKTDSASSDEEVQTGDTPRRVKRKASKVKQRSFEEDACNTFVLKLKPGHVIEQEAINAQELLQPLTPEVQPEPPPPIDLSILGGNVLMKTKRKIFSTTTDKDNKNMKVVCKDLDDSASATESSSKKPSTPSKESKEIAPAIKQMIAKYNKQVESTTKPVSKSPISPVLERKAKEKMEKDKMKSSSLTNVQGISKLTPFEIPDCQYSKCISKSFSAETLSPDLKKKKSRRIRLPIAWDSLKVLPRKSSKEAISTPEKKEKLFKKNKPTSLFSKSAAAFRKIEGKEDGRKIATSSSTDAVIRDSLSLTPTDKLNYNFYSQYSSEPNTPMSDKPKTPISERALKIQKAKEEFLSGVHTLPRQDSKAKNRLSQISIDSDTSLCEGALLKSASVGMISMKAEDSDGLETYDSLPRKVTRSGKFTSKLGFASIASKFRKVKMRRDSRETPSNTVSALCRQSLVVDFKHPTDERTQRQSVPEGKISSVPLSAPLKKSSSSQGSLSGLSTIFNFKFERNPINKSSSANAVSGSRESHV